MSTRAVHADDRTAVPTFVRIPGGEFLHGDAKGDGWEDERPAVRRHIAPFSMSRTPVTTLEFLAFITASNLLREPRPDLYAFPELSNTGLYIGIDGTVMCHPRAARHPVVYVSWHGANAYCAWLRDWLGTSVRLPTDAEWQYAASGGTNRRWSTGDRFERSLVVCNAPEPAPVATRPPSDLGLFDMTGNVFEWVLDTYRVPLEGSPAVELPESRVVKGGAFILREGASMRNARRFSCVAKSCLDCVGFRVVADDAGVTATP